MRCFLDQYIFLIYLRCSLLAEDLPVEFGILQNQQFTNKWHKLVAEAVEFLEILEKKFRKIPLNIRVIKTKNNIFKE